MPLTTVALHAKNYEDLILRRGRQVQWQEAQICSCWNSQTGQAQFNCAACHELGYIYSSPYVGTALVMSITTTKEFMEAGVFDTGDAIMTVPKRYPIKLQNGLVDKTHFIDNPMFDIGMYDLVTLLDDEYKYSVNLVKGAPAHGYPPETLPHPVVTRIKQVYKTDSTTGNITTYLQGTDFTLNGRQIQWIGKQPNAGEQYSVVYFHRPVYTVYTTLPKPRHQDGQDLPRHVVLRYLPQGLIPQRG